MDANLLADPPSAALVMGFGGHTASGDLQERVERAAAGSRLSALCERSGRDDDLNWNVSP